MVCMSRVMNHLFIFDVTKDEIVSTHPKNACHVTFLAYSVSIMEHFEADLNLKDDFELLYSTCLQLRTVNTLYITKTGFLQELKLLTVRHLQITQFRGCQLDNVIRFFVKKNYTINSKILQCKNCQMKCILGVRND